jgi:hypothetical protein
MGRKTPQAWQNCGCWARFGCHGRDGRVIVGVDLDSCLDANGLPAEWAEDVIGRFGSYSEIRPSQTGVKIFALVAGADLPVISAMIGCGHGRQWKGGGPSRLGRETTTRLISQGRRRIAFEELKVR